MNYTVTETRTRVYELRVIEADAVQPGLQIASLQSQFASQGRRATPEDIIAAIRADEQLKRVVAAALGFTVAG